MIRYIVKTGNQLCVQKYFFQKTFVSFGKRKYQKRIVLKVIDLILDYVIHQILALKNQVFLVL